MVRYSGKVGYGEPVESEEGSGVWVDKIIEVPYFGDVIRNTLRQEPGENLNNDIAVGNSISIVADEYATNNYLRIKYIWWQGIKWTVSSVEVKHPRLILSLGNVYNGPVPESD